MKVIQCAILYVWFSLYSSLSCIKSNVSCIDLGWTNYNTSLSSLMAKAWNIQLSTETRPSQWFTFRLATGPNQWEAGGQELPRCLDGNLEHWTQDTLLSRPNAQYEKEQQRVNAVTEHLNLQTATLAMWQLEAVIYNPNTGVIYSNWADRVQSGGNQRRLHRLNRHQLLCSHPKVLPTSGRQQTLNS